jgi:arsenical pump membrane protein
MKTALVGAVLLVLGLAAWAFGILDGAEVLALTDRIWPVLLFVVAITVVAELADQAGVFQSIAGHAARLARGRTVVLWLFVVLMAVVSTAFLSLDTTAVLLTPIVVVLARRIGVSPLPFALTTVWLANTASLFLPVSNLTNLLAEHRLGGVGPLGFLALSFWPALVGVVVPVVVLAIVYRRPLSGRFTVDAAAPASDRLLFVTSAVVLVLLLPLLVSGLPVWLPASAAALLLIAVTAWRNPRVLRFDLVPWQLVVLASGLFLSMAALHNVGLGAFLEQVAGTGNSPADLLRLSASAGVGANLVDNLPAYLALEPAATSPDRLIALLIGVNLGPLVTPWASLATLLWHQRLTAMDVRISWTRYALLGLIVAPITVVGATLALAFL